jgi:hypothetical protein
MFESVEGAKNLLPILSLSIEFYIMSHLRWKIDTISLQSQVLSTAQILRKSQEGNWLMKPKTWYILPLPISCFWLKTLIFLFLYRFFCSESMKALWNKAGSYNYSDWLSSLTATAFDIFDLAVIYDILSVRSSTHMTVMLLSKGNLEWESWS